MGAAILITVGVLGLLNEFYIAPFHNTWPLLLIVIGLFAYMGTSASIEGHIDPQVAAGVMPPPPPPTSQNPEVHP